jgi:hypothetical protein
VRFIDLEDRALCPIVDEVVRAVLDPSITDIFVGPLVVGSTNHELLFGPDQRGFEAEARMVEGGDKAWEQWATRYGDICGGAPYGMRERHTHRGFEWPARSGSPSFAISFWIRLPRSKAFRNFVLARIVDVFIGFAGPDTAGGPFKRSSLVVPMWPASRFSRLSGHAMVHDVERWRFEQRRFRRGVRPSIQSNDVLPNTSQSTAAWVSTAERAVRVRLGPPPSSSPRRTIIATSAVQ